MWILPAFGSALCAGLTAVLAKIGLDGVDSTLATALRTGVVLIFAWGIVFASGGAAGLYALSGRTLFYLILSGLATGGSWLCYFRALRLADVSQVAPIDKSSTILTMLFAWAFLGESMTVLKAAAMLLIGVGTWLMVRPQGKVRAGGFGGASGPNEPQGANAAAPLPRSPAKPAAQSAKGLLFAAGAALFAAATAILGKIGIEGVDSNLGTAIRTGVVLLLSWGMVFLAGRQRQIKTLTRRNWWFSVLSGLATGASWLCYFRALQTGPASVVVPIDKLSILVTILFARLWLKERQTPRSLFGLALNVAGTLLLLI